MTSKTKASYPLYFYLINAFNLALAIAYSPRDRDLPYGPNEVSGHFTQSRVRRVAKVIGYSVFLATRAAKVVENILSTAKPVPSGSLFSRQFEKNGGYARAVHDFDSFKFTSVITYERPGGIKEMEGKVGNMVLFVTNKGKLGQPIMKIFYDLNTPQTRWDKIVYME